MQTRGRSADASPGRQAHGSWGGCATQAGSVLPDIPGILQHRPPTSPNWSVALTDLSAQLWAFLSEKIRMPAARLLLPSTP